jgi:RNA polymerase sigma-70 factor (ECF subfamily)
VDVAADALAVADGDQARFLRLIEPALPGAHRLARAMLDGRPEAEDAVQEAVIKAWRHFYRFDTTRRIEPWLLAIVANECRSHRRSRWWSLVPLPDASGTRPTADPVSAEVADLRRALRLLPHNQRLLIVLRYYLDQSFEEIGATLGVSKEAAKLRIFRALTRLRVELPEDNHD